MNEQLQKCPVCGKPLTQEEYDKALGIWEEKHKEIKHLEEERAKLKKEKAEVKQSARLEIAAQKRKFTEELKQSKKATKEEYEKKLAEETAKGVARITAKQNKEFRKKSAEFNRSENKRKQLENSLKLALEKDQKHQEEIKRLHEQLERGTTPQIEGLLEENKLLAKLQELFPQDQFEHPGKVGDIIQTVINQGKVAGKIVYECKKVKVFSQAHVKQASDARESRKADFAVLVTNAFPSKKQFYFVSNTVFVISPVSVEPVTYAIRESLIKIALLQLSNTAKEKAVNEIYRYLSGNEYSNKVNIMASQLLDLAGDLKSEITSHRQSWRRRYIAYKNLYMDLGVIDSRLKNILMLSDEYKAPKLISNQQKEYPSIEELDKR